MARAKKKKTDQDVPPLYMLVGENGHLVPAAEYDFMRVSSYKENTRMVVYILPDGVRPGVRSWWVTIGNAIKKGFLDLTQSAADEALRGAVDLYRNHRMKNGNWIEERMSLNDLDDAELDEKVELMKGVLVAWTGVDPDTFAKETADTAPAGFESDYRKQGFASSPAADLPQGNAGEAASVESPSDAATPSPEDPNPFSGGTPAAADASTPHEDEGSGGPFDEAFDAIAMAIKLMPERVVPGSAGSEECPRCGGLVKWSRAKNGHVWIQCVDGENRGCFGPIHLAIDAKAVWPGPREESSGEATTAESPVEADRVAAPGGTEGSGSDGLAKTDEPGLPPADRAFLVEAAKTLMAIAKEGTSRGDVIKVAGPLVKKMPISCDKNGGAERLDRIKNHVLEVGRGEVQVDWDFAAAQALCTVADIS